MADQNEEEDYMSEEFLKRVVEAGEAKMKENGVSSSSAKRSRSKSPVVISVGRIGKMSSAMATSIVAGANKEIDSSNRGAQMLAKMGFKKGMTLGVGPRSAQAMNAPLPIEIRADRKGLGEKSENEDKRVVKARISEDLEADFKARMREKFSHKFDECEAEDEDEQSKSEANQDKDEEDDIEEGAEDNWIAPPPVDPIKQLKRGNASTNTK